jgi:hypothetical protein
MRSNVEIARAADLRPIGDIAGEIGVRAEELHLYGRDVAKIDLAILERPRPRPAEARLLLVSAITPTPAGEGKTTTSIGLGDGLRRLGESVCVALREPSLGPCMGVKGGATGGGLAQIALRRPQARGPAGGFRCHGAQHPGQCRCGVPGGAHGRHHAHARAPTAAAGRSDRRARRRHRRLGLTANRQGSTPHCGGGGFRRWPKLRYDVSRGGGS